MSRDDEEEKEEARPLLSICLYARRLMFETGPIALAQFILGVLFLDVSAQVVLSL